MDTGTDKNSREFVVNLFNNISPRYDIANTILSFGIERLWRRKLLKYFSTGAGKILDVCCGTGTSSYRIHKKFPDSHIWGIDFSEKMLEAAVGKYGAISGMEFIRSDAAELNFEDRFFDAVTISFGIRNIIDRKAALKEFCRVTNKGGSLLILEFGNIKSGIFSKLYNLYLKIIMPAIGGIISGNKNAYRYLYDTIRQFPEPQELNNLIITSGWQEVKTIPLLYGACNIYLAVK